MVCTARLQSVDKRFRRTYRRSACLIRSVNITSVSIRCSIQRNVARLPFLSGYGSARTVKYEKGYAERAYQQNTYRKKYALLQTLTHKNLPPKFGSPAAFLYARVRIHHIDTILLYTYFTKKSILSIRFYNFFVMPAHEHGVTVLAESFRSLSGELPTRSNAATTSRHLTRNQTKLSSLKPPRRARVRAIFCPYLSAPRLIIYYSFARYADS